MTPSVQHPTATGRESGAQPGTTVSSGPLERYAGTMQQAACAATSIVGKCAHGLIQIALAVCVLATPGGAFSQVRDRDRVVFVLHERSPAAGVLETFDRMQGQLGELDLDIFAVRVARLHRLSAQARQAAEVAERREAAAVFWFAPRARASLRVYALHVPSGRVFARDVSLAQDATVQREQLAIVLRAAVPAVLEGGRDLGEPLLVVQPESAAPESPRPPPSPSPEAAAVGGTGEQPRLRAALGYARTAIAPTAGWQSGASMQLVLDAAGWLRASSGVGYAFPIAIEGQGADAIIKRATLVAKLGAGWSTGRAAVGVEVGPLVEMWHRRTVVHAEELEPTPPSTLWRPGGVLEARLELLVGLRMGLYALAGVQWLPTPHGLTIRSAQTGQQLATYAVRPHVGLGATFDLLSRTASGGRAENSTSPDATGH